MRHLPKLDVRIDSPAKSMHRYMSHTKLDGDKNSSVTLPALHRQ